MGPWSHEEEVETFRGDVDLSAGADGDPRPRARLLRPLPQGRVERLGRAPAARALRPRRERVARRAASGRSRGTEFTPWYLRERRRARRADVAARRDEPADRYAYDPADPVPTIGGVNSVLTMTQGARDADPPGPDRPARARARATTCSSTRATPLERDLEVIGPVEMVLYAASSAKDTDFIVRLCDVHPDGKLDLRHRGDPPRALPELERGRLDGAARARRGRRVPDPLLPGGERVQARATGCGST